MAVGQQQHVVLPGHLPEKMVQPAARNADQRFGLLAMFPQSAIRHDIGFASLRGVQPVLIQAAQPTAHDMRVALSGAAPAHLFDLADVGGMQGFLTRHVVSMLRPVCAGSTGQHAQRRIGL
ncbi:hypothetical protein D3C72_1205980 [compost metagenome]